MSEKATWTMVFKKELSAAGVGVVLLAMGGCASEAPKPAQTVTQDQVRSNADKAFKNLQQEQKNRAGRFEEDPY
jgi:ABC-type transporter MlaC component